MCTLLGACIYSPQIELFKSLLKKASQKEIDDISMALVSPNSQNEKDFLLAIIEEKGQLPSCVVKYFITSNYGCQTGNIEMLIEHREYLLFLQENGADLSLLFDNGDGSPGYIEYLVNLGASVDSKVISQCNRTPLNNFRPVMKSFKDRKPPGYIEYLVNLGASVDSKVISQCNRTPLNNFRPVMKSFKDRKHLPDLPRISFREFVDTGKSTEDVYYPTKGIFCNKYRDEYIRILYGGFWRNYTKYITFPEKVSVENNGKKLNSLVLNMKTVDPGVISGVKEFI